ALKEQLEACFLAVMCGTAENDGYNALVLAAGLPWREVAIVRAISRFFRQIRIAYSQDYLWATLRKHPDVAGKLVRLFQARFDPQLAIGPDERRRQEAEILHQIEGALQSVESLDEDRILRRFAGAISAAV